jgi:hypothetical protein
MAEIRSAPGAVYATPVKSVLRAPDTRPGSPLLPQRTRSGWGVLFTVGGSPYSPIASRAFSNAKRRAERLGATGRRPRKAPRNESGVPSAAHRLSVAGWAPCGPWHAPGRGACRSKGPAGPRRRPARAGSWVTERRVQRRGPSAGARRSLPGTGRPGPAGCQWQHPQLRTRPGDRHPSQRYTRLDEGRRIFEPVRRGNLHGARRGPDIAGSVEIIALRGGRAPA